MHGRGLICLPLEEEQLDRLDLGMMVPDFENTTPYGTAFTVSIEAARRRVTTGISAADRSADGAGRRSNPEATAHRHRRGPATSSRCAPERAACCAGWARPKAPWIWARLAGCHPSGVICEIMNDDGSMARMPDLIEFGRRSTTSRS